MGRNEGAWGRPSEHRGLPFCLPVREGMNDTVTSATRPARGLLWPSSKFDPSSGRYEQVERWAIPNRVPFKGEGGDPGPTRKRE